MPGLPLELPPELGDAATPACHGFGVGGANRGEEELLKKRFGVPINDVFTEVWVSIFREPSNSMVL